MPTLEERLQQIEDRFALEDALTRYCTGIDSLEDVDALLESFTDDAVFDLTGIDLPRFEGREALRGFFVQVFDDMTHHAHFTTNFAIDEITAGTARCTAYVMGMGVARDGNDVLVYVKYFLDFVKQNGGWKIRNFGEASLMPLPESLTEIHGRD